jgi:hypothetical protein
MEKQNTSQDSFDFHMREFESLKKEIAVSIYEERALERYVLIGTGIVWVWLLTNQNVGTPKIGWWIPFFFVLLGSLRSITLLLTIQRMAQYIKLIEKVVTSSKGIPGWEHYCEENRIPFVSISAGIFWGASLVATAIAPFVLT